MVNLTGFRAVASLSDSTAEADPRARLRAMMRRAEAGGDQPAPERSGVDRWMRRWIPETWRLSRLDPGRLGVLGLVLAGVAALVAIVLGTGMGRPAAEPAPPPPPPPVEEVTSTAEEQPLVVSVVGRVARPGLVTVPAGRRVADALREAGGALPGTDVTSLNLARKLSDGEQLYVGIPTPPPRPDEREARAGEAAGGKVDLNAATESQLDELPGVGEVTAERIVRWRDEHGGFDSVEQLREVDGIGQTRFSRLREQVRV